MNKANDLLRCVDPKQFKIVLNDLRNHLYFERGESWESRTMFLCQVVVELHAMLATEKTANLCDVCCGDGKLSNCICDGTGRMSDAARNLRKMLQAVELPQVLRKLLPTVELPQEEDWQERCNRFRAIGPPPNYKPQYGEIWRAPSNFMQFKIEAVTGNLVFYSSLILGSTGCSESVSFSTTKSWCERIQNFQLIEICRKMDGM